VWRQRRCPEPLGASQPQPELPAAPLILINELKTTPLRIVIELFLVLDELLQVVVKVFDELLLMVS
jgi:hypothetical protein